MGSPFRSAANAVFSVPVSSGAFTTDAVGNQVETTTITTLKAYLSLDFIMEKVLQQPVSTNRTEIYMVGYAVDPKYLPASIRTGDTLDCTITDAASGNVMTGKFVFSLLVQTPWKAVPKALGNKFKGYFYAA